MYIFFVFEYIRILRNMAPCQIMLFAVLKWEWFKEFPIRIRKKIILKFHRFFCSFRLNSIYAKSVMPNQTDRLVVIITNKILNQNCKIDWMRSHVVASCAEPKLLHWHWTWMINKKKLSKTRVSREHTSGLGARRCWQTALDGNLSQKLHDILGRFFSSVVAKIH